MTDATAPTEGAFRRKARTSMRWILAGPVALVAAVLAMAITPLALPPGVAGVNHLVFAIVLFPLYWAATFLYAVMAEKIRWATLVFTLFFAGAGFLIWRAFS